MEKDIIPSAIISEVLASALKRAVLSRVCREI